MSEFQRKPRSEAESDLLRRTQRVLSSAPRGPSPRPEYAMIVREAHGSRIVDSSGNEYIDYLLGSGPMLLGHAHPAVVGAVRDALPRGSNYLLVNESAVALAEEIVRATPCAEKVSFHCSGSEAVFFALRLARAHRGRDRFLVRWIAQDEEQQQRDAERDLDVGDVEGGPVRRIDEVRHRAVGDPVDQVAERAAREQADRQPAPVSPAADREVAEEQREGASDEHEHGDAGAVEEAKGDPLVADPDQADSRDQIDPLARADLGSYDALGELVERQCDQRHDRCPPDRLTVAAHSLISPTTIPCRMSSTITPMIGLKSSAIREPPIGGRTRRNRFRYGSTTLSMKSVTALSARL